MTSLPRAEYYTRGEFYRYFENIVGRIQMQLLGVFLTNPYPKIVNVSLWTIPYELECYLALILLYWIGLIQRKRFLVLLITLAIIAGTVAAFSSYDLYWANNRPLGRALVVAFLCGVAINLFADKIRLNAGLALSSAMAVVVLCLDYRTIYLATVPAAYITVYIGMLNPPKRSLLFSGDYSYGLDVFAFPIQKMLSYYLPVTRVWYINSVLAVTIGFAYATFSWHCVEKPVLSRKRFIVGAAEAFTARFRRRGRAMLSDPQG